MKRMIYCVFIFLCFGFSATQNQPVRVSFDFINTDLVQTIRVLAMSLNQSVLFSADVKGVVTLHLQNAIAKDALDSLLLANGLMRSEKNHLWLIAKRETLIKLTQEDVKWQETQMLDAPLISQSFQIRYAKADDIVKMLQEKEINLLSKRGAMSADMRTNTIFVRDVSNILQLFQEWVTKLDVPVKQILIEARLASVDYDYERELGVRFRNTGKNANTGHDVGRYSLLMAKLADGSWLDVKLALLEKEGHAHLISRPSLFTTNRETASIEAGEEIPYQEVSESGGTAVVFKKAVLALHVTPQILPNNRILLQMQINQDRPNDKIVQGVPTISTRQMTTTVLAKNGETVVLGGVYEADEEKGEEGLPLLNRLPVIGVLFKDTNLKRRRRELLIFVTPKVMA